MHSAIVPPGGTLNHIRVDLDQPGRLFLVSLCNDLVPLKARPFQFLTKFDFCCG